MCIEIFIKYMSAWMDVVESKIRDERIKIYQNNEITYSPEAGSEDVLSAHHRVTL
jgi:hypothetical protein